MDLDPKKYALQNDIPVKIFKQKPDFASAFISKIFNKTIGNVNSPDDIKIADITPVYEKNNHKCVCRYFTSIF